MDLQQKALTSLLLVGSFLLIDVNSECTWTRGNTCYTLVEEVQQQAQAQANCVEMYKGNLVSITSQDEDDFIRARYLDHFRNITAFVSTIYYYLYFLFKSLLPVLKIVSKNKIISFFSYAIHTN